MLWLLVNAGSKYWQSRWEHEVIVRERRLTLDDPMFAAKRQQTDQYVRQSLSWNDHGTLQRIVDQIVLLKPSVSFMMTILSVAFLLGWAGLVFQRFELQFNPNWITLNSVRLAEFQLSVLSSLTAIAFVYLLYIASAAYARQRIAKAECWWLPGARAFRFVIRNLPRRANLSSVRYRAWLRTVIPASDTISVKTFIDDELVRGERLLLPGHQDHPVVCFRLGTVEHDLTFVLTDKMGNLRESRPLVDGGVSLMIEFSVRARTWLLFKHEISRLYSIPCLRERLLPVQRSAESQLKSVLQRADEVTVTL